MPREGNCKIFLIHRVSPNAENDRWGLTITPDEFEQILVRMLNHGNLFSVKDALDKLWNGDQTSTIALTIDDGYFDLTRYAYPILKKYNIPATIFVPSYYVESQKPFWWEIMLWLDNHQDLLCELSSAWNWSLESHTLKTVDKWCGKMKKLSMLEREALLLDVGYPKTLAGAMSIENLQKTPKLCSIGCHGHSHTVLSALSEEEVKEELYYSIECSKRWDKSGPDIFAYPNGQTNDFRKSDIKHLKKCGMRGALTTIKGINRMDTDPFHLKRFSLSPGGALLELETALARDN